MIPIFPMLLVFVWIAGLAPAAQAKTGKRRSAPDVFSFDSFDLHKILDDRKSDRAAEAARLSITEEESDAINKYTSGFYEQINAALRRPSPLSQELSAYKKLLSSGLQKIPNYQSLVYRDATLSMSLLNKRYVIGSEVTEPFYLSASVELHGGKLMKAQKPKQVLKERMAREAAFREGKPQVLFLIQSKTAKDISQFSVYPDEKEVLFDSGTRFKVRDRRVEDSLVIIELDEV